MPKEGGSSKRPRKKTAKSSAKTTQSRADAKKLIETYFGDIPSQTQPKHPELAEPAEFQAATKQYKDPLARVPGVVIGYPGPKRRSPDYYALNMIDAILTAGDSSRFRQDLVKGKQSVIQYEANLGWPFASSLGAATLIGTMR